MKRISIGFLLMVAFVLIAGAQRRKSTPASSSYFLSSELFKNYSFRNIGPAFMSGRIADIAIHPENENTWYIAVGSGGVWKTENAGVTFNPLFDDQKSYSIGCVALDLSNPNVVWVGTGENVGGRHVGFGDGIYRSMDGGSTWENMGLPNSNHISKIDVHPDNADVIRVAAQGPLWYPGGDRGFYLSEDGGKTWKKTLGDEQYTGVTDFAVDPRDPNRIYAATWQHHRTVAAWMGGGPKSRIHLSTDGGRSWQLLRNGLPEGNMGKIGLAISPIDPDVVYAAIELDRITGGVFRSSDRGGSWKKMSDAVAGATGPHYYQELYASPHKFDRLYLVDNWMQISEDGGKTFTRLNRSDKHGDNHAIAFKKSDPDYLLVGTDGGVYESFDLGQNWRFMENLPITQFYKVAVDDSEPFYNIYGGTQDNSTQGGPSRTDNLHGIRNADWKVVLNWDGHQPATEPGNPNIIYAERQEGNLSRIDMTTGEVTDIQPQADAGEPYERFNWDAPILVSPHSPTTLFFGSQRVWKSENRGDSWTAISQDLTKNQERLALPIMGRVQSWDAPWDVNAMSNYNTITSLAESPKKAGVIYAGTDDGIIQVTENGGTTWRQISVGNIPGVPATAFVNDIKADLFDESTVYVALDNHKYGDFKPYLAVSRDKGNTWSLITTGLSNRNLVWRVVQDHVNPSLMFAATEFGVFFTIDAGAHWTELPGNVPTISFRDLAIQRRENDLVAASFGRGFFILDDYSALRGLSSAVIQQEATLFKPRDAWWYIPRSVLDFEDKRGSQGTQHYVAPNPEFGATFSFYLKDDVRSLKEMRQASEKARNKQGQNIPFPGWEALEKEKLEEGPYLFIEIKNEAGAVVNRVEASGKKGMNRKSWDLRYASANLLRLDGKVEAESGRMVTPGTYSATLMKMQNGKVVALGESVSFNVKRLYEGHLPSDINVTADFWKQFDMLSRDAGTFELALGRAIRSADRVHIAAVRGNVDTDLIEQAVALENDVKALQSRYGGNQAKGEIGEKSNPVLGDRLFALWKGVTRSTYGPTETHKKVMQLANQELKGLQSTLSEIERRISALSDAIVQAGGPTIEGQ